MAAAEDPHDIGVCCAGRELGTRLTFLENELNVMARHGLGHPAGQFLRVHVDHGYFEFRHVLS